MKVFLFKTRWVWTPLVALAVGFWLSVILIGCGNNWRFPTQTPPDTSVRTPTGNIKIVNAELLNRNKLSRIDKMWADAQDCYGVILDGTLLTIEVMPVHECWWSVRHGFDICGMYDYERKTIVTNRSLRYLPEEIAHYIEFELGISNPWEPWDSMHDRMDKRAARCGTRWWNAAGYVAKGLSNREKVLK